MSAREVEHAHGTQFDRAASAICDSAWGHDANDLALPDLICDLSLASPEFARLWAQQHVKQKSHGPKTIHHPLTGQINLHYETFRLPDQTGTALVMYTATDEASADSLQLLLGWKTQTDVFTAQLQLLEQRGVATTG